MPVSGPCSEQVERLIRERDEARDHAGYVEEENDRLRDRLALAVGNPCAGCQAENERLREALRLILNADPHGAHAIAEEALRHAG